MGKFSKQVHLQLPKADFPGKRQNCGEAYRSFIYIKAEQAFSSESFFTGTIATFRRLLPSPGLLSLFYAELPYL